MNSLDSWIDLGEISELINQLLPPKPEESDRGVSLLGTPAAAGRIAQSKAGDDDPPLSLIPDVPPEWEMAQPAGFSPTAFPSLDDLPGPQSQAPAPTPAPAAEPARPASEFSPQPPPLPTRPPESIAQDPPAALELDDEEEEFDPFEQPRLNPANRAKIQATLAEIRNMAGDFLGPAPADMPPPPPLSPAPIQVAEAPGVEPEAEPEPELPKVAPADPKEQALFLPQGPLGARLKAYAKWVRGITDCQQLMVSDPQGYPLLPAENDEDAPLISSSLQLMSALSHARRKMDATGPNSGVYLPLGPDRWLGVLDCESGSQRVCVSMITGAPLSAAAADELTAGLKRALEGVAA